MAAINTYLKESAVEPGLRHLISLRTSQINGCAYCIDLHTYEALQDGERTQRVNCLIAWHETTLFTAQERAALAWIEALTNIAATHAPEDVYTLVEKHFNGKDLVDLTLMIASMNAWNRMAIGFRRQPTVR
jgi:AhpD family alkylhydroperoxidase